MNLPLRSKSSKVRGQSCESWMEPDCRRDWTPKPSVRRRRVSGACKGTASAEASERIAIDRVSRKCLIFLACFAGRLEPDSEWRIATGRARIRVRKSERKAARTLALDLKPRGPQGLGGIAQPRAEDG